MFSDIHGYSRMMGRDEEATLRLLDELTGLMTPRIAEHRGTVLKFIGDAVLAVFDSAADAVECALREGFENAMNRYNVAEPPGAP